MGDGYPADWDRRRKIAYRRDDYQCQECGRQGGPHGDAELHAHHIRPKSEGGSHRLSNLKTLCDSCHEQVHGHAVGGQQPSTATINEGSERDSGLTLGSGVFIIWMMIYLVGGSLLYLFFRIPRIFEWWLWISIAIGIPLYTHEKWGFPQYSGSVIQDTIKGWGIYMRENRNIAIGYFLISILIAWVRVS